MFFLALVFDPLLFTWGRTIRKVMGGGGGGEQKKFEHQESLKKKSCRDFSIGKIISSKFFLKIVKKLMVRPLDLNLV